MAVNLTLNRNRQVPAEETPAFGSIAERFRRAGQLDRAVSLCLDGLKRFPAHNSARVTLGWALMDLGRYDDARKELEQVLKRAPDNLAAIRGLAELHDRAEHTMSLPMDGPGQWPPDDATVDALASDKELEAAPPVTFVAEEAPSPRAEHLPATIIEEPEVDPVVETTPAVAAAAMAEVPTPVEAPFAAVEADALREAELSLETALSEEVFHQDAVDPLILAADQGFSVPEADIEALLAEAESLEAAAEVQVEPDPVVLFEADAAEEVAGLEVAGLVEETAAVVDVTDEDEDVVVPAAVAALSAVEPDPVVLFEADAAEEVAGLEVAGLVEETAAVVDVTDEDEDVVVPAAVAALSAVEPEPAWADVPVVLAEHVMAAEETVLAAAESVEAIAEALPEPVVSAKSPVAALERFLGRVQARRLQLMAESVA